VLIRPIQTHIDIVEDFDLDLAHQLVGLSEKHDFFIFEDRKFADIGMLYLQAETPPFSQARFACRKYC
jgi:hypothetical protein